MPLRNTRDPNDKLLAPQLSNISDNDHGDNNKRDSRRSSWGRGSLNLLDWSFTASGSNKAGGESSPASKAAAEVAKSFNIERRGSSKQCSSYARRGSGGNSYVKKGSRGSYGEGSISDPHVDLPAPDPYAPPPELDESDTSREKEACNSPSASIASKKSAVNLDDCDETVVATEGAEQHKPWHVKHYALMVSMAGILVAGGIAIGVTLGVNGVPPPDVRNPFRPTKDVFYGEVVDSERGEGVGIESDFGVEFSSIDSSIDISTLKQPENREQQQQEQQQSEQDQEHQTQLYQQEQQPQHLLEISEQIVSACSETQISQDASACKHLCHNRLCCFEKQKFNCENDAEKYCAVYAGCEILMEGGGAGIVPVGDHSSDKAQLKEARRIHWG